MEVPQRAPNARSFNELQLMHATALDAATFVHNVIILFSQSWMISIDVLIPNSILGTSVHASARIRAWGRTQGRLRFCNPKRHQSRHLQRRILHGEAESLWRHQRRLHAPLQERTGGAGADSRQGRDDRMDEETTYDYCYHPLDCHRSAWRAAQACIPRRPRHQWLHAAILRKGPR